MIAQPPFSLSRFGPNTSTPTVSVEKAPTLWQARLRRLIANHGTSDARNESALLRLTGLPVDFHCDWSERHRRAPFRALELQEVLSPPPLAIAPLTIGLADFWQCLGMNEKYVRG